MKIHLLLFPKYFQRLRLVIVSHRTANLFGEGEFALVAAVLFMKIEGRLESRPAGWLYRAAWEMDGVVLPDDSTMDGWKFLQPPGRAAPKISRIQENDSAYFFFPNTSKNIAL